MWDKRKDWKEENEKEWLWWWAENKRELPKRKEWKNQQQPTKNIQLQHIQILILVFEQINSKSPNREIITVQHQKNLSRLESMRRLSVTENGQILSSCFSTCHFRFCPQLFSSFITWLCPHKGKPIATHKNTDKLHHYIHLLSSSTHYSKERKDITEGIPRHKDFLLFFLVQTFDDSD